MEFPKAVMTISELVDFGFSTIELRRIYDEVGYPVAFKTHPSMRNSTIKFDTVALDKYIKKINTIDNMNKNRRSL